MALTLVTNPVGSAASKVFAGFQAVEFIFKREDLTITGVTSGTGGAKITVATNLTSYLVPGDTLYLYSEGTNYTYNLTAEILAITATEITIDSPYIETGTGGYINYLKKYYVELQCVHPTLPAVNLLPFNLQADGDAAGNIRIDVSIVNDLNRQRGAIVQGLISESSQEFEIQYRQVYTGSSESFTLVDNKRIILLYAIDEPEVEEILNNFDLPSLYLGYPSALVIANMTDAASAVVELKYNELDMNLNQVAVGTLSTIASDVNGFLLWKWLASASVNEATHFIEFNLAVTVTFDFLIGDFAHPDFKVQ